jgi:hypothetical protein
VSPPTCDEPGDPTTAEAPRHDLAILTRSYLALEDDRDLLRSQLLAERSRRLHDLGHIDSVTAALTQSRADAAELRKRNAELGAELDALRLENVTLRDALTSAAWSPHVLRLRSLWRRLPGWLRTSVHHGLSAVSRILGSRR